VPHVQIDVEAVPDVNDELHRLAFALPGVENRATIVSLPGARGMWLDEGISLAHPETIVSGREFAHIHPDGSLHAPLPFERALEAVEKGWAERHPWADEREGWDGFVMLFTPQSMDELDVTFQLILESYNFVTGRSLTISDLDL
jgi:phospholipase/carboxylesterase